MNQRTILITGGSGKVGGALVSHFLDIGERVITTCQTDQSLRKLESQHERHKSAFIAFKADFIKAETIGHLVQECDKRDIRPDCLVNNARSLSFLKIGNDGQVSRANFLNEFLLDVIAPYELTMAIVGQRDSQLRRVVNIGSMYGSVAANMHLYTEPVKQSPLHYSVSKAALSHLTKELAVRLADRNIQVNCVAFGGVEGRVDTEFEQRYKKLSPMGRMLKLDEVSGPVDMLLSAKCSGITGHTLAVDGGWSIW